MLARGRRPRRGGRVLSDRRGRARRGQGRGDVAHLRWCAAGDGRLRDHVNRLEFHGLDGVRESVAIYRALFPDLRIEVVDQVAEGDRVASRWRMRGTHRGRVVELGGITISRLEDGKIVEDWGYTDSLDLLRGLGLRRSVAALPRLLGAVRSHGS